jgi:hypothetical protein
MTLLSTSHDALPQIYFVTDGSVDDERNICHSLKTQLIKSGSKSPRISTFGLGNILFHNWVCNVQLILLLLKTYHAKPCRQILCWFFRVMYASFSPTASFYEGICRLS